MGNFIAMYHLETLQYFIKVRTVNYDFVVILKCVKYTLFHTYKKHQVVFSSQMRILSYPTTSVAFWEWLIKVLIATALSSTSHYSQPPGWTTNMWLLGNDSNRLHTVYTQESPSYESLS